MRRRTIAKQRGTTMPAITRRLLTTLTRRKGISTMQPIMQPKRQSYTPSTMAIKQ